MSKSIKPKHQVIPLKKHSFLLPGSLFLMPRDGITISPGVMTPELKSALN